MGNDDFADEPALGPSAPRFARLVEACASDDEVRSWVQLNHDNNMWWPIAVGDPRLRMLIAGLSTRVSYRMLRTYQRVVQELQELGWNAIQSGPEGALRRVIAPLGLVEARFGFLRSLREFFSHHSEDELRRMGDNELISLLQREVKGAGYKVAQCCVAYARGYHSGTMPVDSGMKDTMLPCLGFPSAKGAIGHEQMRRQLETMTSRIDARAIAHSTGYSGLALPQAGPLSWWTHLVLIYFKRLRCNERQWQSCPLARLGAGKMCRKAGGFPGGRRVILIEGINGAGKTTICRMVRHLGFRVLHMRHDPSSSDLVGKYTAILQGQSHQRLCLDRSFVSEAVYGPVLRGTSRLAASALDHLFQLCGERNGVIVHLISNQKTCLSRCRREDRRTVETRFDELRAQYAKVLASARQHLDVLEIDVTSRNAAEVLSVLGCPVEVQGAL